MYWAKRCFESSEYEDFIKKLYDSLPERINKVIVRKRGYIDSFFASNNFYVCRGW
jgi:hypothetical protein